MRENFDPITDIQNEPVPRKRTSWFLHCPLLELVTTHAMSTTICVTLQQNKERMKMLKSNNIDLHSLIIDIDISGEFVVELLMVLMFVC